MKVILLHEVAGLGQAGDVKEVADGYARNFLLPRQLVTAATPSQLASLRERVATEKRRLEKTQAGQAALAARIESISLKFAVKVGAGGRLYGSVTNQNIADALVEQENLSIDRRTIQLPDPLRHLGSFEVPIRIAPKVEPKLKVSIVPAGAEEEGATAEHTSEANSVEAQS